MPISAPRLVVEGLSAGYGAVRALENVSLSLAPGETVALLGTSGNGKSTLINTIMGLVRARGGAIYLEEAGRRTDLAGSRTETIADLGLALVPEGRRLFPKLTVTENLLLGAYCLGRLYDEHKTQSRRELYTTELDRHMERFAADPTADDARFFKAQLEEQRLQATAALPLYLKIPADHPRFSEASAGAARCYETILVRMRERKLPTSELEQAAISTLQQLVPKQESTETVWTEQQCEVALHLAAILLMVEPPRFERAEQLLGQVAQSAAQVKETDAWSERW